MNSKVLAAIGVICVGVLAAGCGGEPDAQAEAESEMPAAAAYDRSAESNTRFLADNAAREGVTVQPSGLQYRVIEAGNGAGLSSPEDLVTVSYRGWLIDDTVFDGTDEGQTIEFPADGLISGWVEALSLMKEGDEWELVIPSELGYGAFGAGGVIPPNQTLVFNMRLISIAPADQP